MLEQRAGKCSRRWLPARCLAHNIAAAVGCLAAHRGGSTGSQAQGLGCRRTRKEKPLEPGQERSKGPEALPRISAQAHLAAHVLHGLARVVQAEE